MLVPIIRQIYGDGFADSLYEYYALWRMGFITLPELQKHLEYLKSADDDVKAFYLNYKSWI